MKEVSRTEMMVQMDRQSLEALKKGGSPDIEEIRAVFHSLWTKAVGKSEYDKREWAKLQDMLARRGLWL